MRRTRADRPLPFAPPDIEQADIDAVADVLASRWITSGPKVREFEHAIAEACGRKHAVAVNSATAALHLALDAINLAPGDEVIVPTTTFTATAEVVRYFDAKPVLVDVTPDILCLDPGSANDAISRRTRAIVPVHFGGHAANMDAIQTLAKDNGLTVVDDAAHGFSGSYKGRPIGSLGDISALSFYATKTITTGEGGMLLTDDDAVENRARIMSLHGMSRDSWNRYSGTGDWRYDVIAPGFKYNLTDMAAALGLSQLNRAAQMLERRRQIAARYTAAFSSLEMFQPPVVLLGVEHSWHLYVLRLHLDQLRIHRDEFIDRLKARGISASVHFIPLHMFTYYRNMYRFDDSDFPVATREFTRCMSLPIFSSMADADVSDVIDIVSDIATRNRR